ncbi:HlyD family efflux transporter periplasmic adaptor subunit [Nisaea acidiphila]|uniref:HlyD family efflux transporter periplasmic adaptor subunit n=1 Tax=Nisaea acidiphila TaxID=1862145 RepID=A0A9J7AWF2_9PROT|nr:HlyD family efflux transporter periplasmic adaptor subunit [Nisaea acidiphila]UUX51687.1 HlyD family efflux transporter periplasmic adaptor subunit [Nisaea acidiphila]
MLGYRTFFIAILLAALAGGGYWYTHQENGLPDGFARGNGRLETERVDIASKFSGRISELLVTEGEMVAAGQVVARLDATEITAQLREAEAAVVQAQEALNEALALQSQRESELVLADQEMHRAETLGEKGFASGETLDRRRSERATAAAALASAKAGIARARAAIEARKATVERIKADLTEFEIAAPIAGRVQYRLAEPGEIVSAGGKIVTMLDLKRVYMTIYLPTRDAGRIAYGAEARLIFDAAPQYVIPARVTFVAAEAQFTPRYVETESERDKLMFRVKVSIPAEILDGYERIVKGGLPGIAVVRTVEDLPWPDEYAVNLPPRDA